MTSEVVFIIVLVLIILFLFAGMYIHSILLAAGVIGIILLEGPTYLVGFLESDPFIRVASYSLSTIPLFVMMAQFIIRSGIVEDLYTYIYNVSKGRSGILGVLTVLAGGLLGAVSGSTNASAAAMGQVAVPQLLKRGYSPAIAGATVAAAGSLSTVIPPSIGLILWGVLTETPIGELFIGSLVPGIIMMIIICITLLFLLNMSNKSKIDKSKTTAFKKEPISGFRIGISLGLTGIIATVVFVGIYAGWFTPTEAGSIGAFIAFLVAVLLGRVNKKFFFEAFEGTVKITSMIMLIMVSAQIFGRFVSVSLLPRKLIEFLSSFMEYPLLILLILAIIYFLLFMLIEAAAVMVMTAPIVIPLITQLGVDQIWFGVFICILATIGLLTPPVGLAVFSVSGVTGISSEKIFRYALIYALVLTVVVLALMFFVPGIATWLPSKM